MNDSHRYYEPIVYVVPLEEDGFLVRTILQHRLHLSRKLVSRLKLTEQGLTLNGKRVTVADRVKAGDRVECRMEQEQSEDILPQDIPFEILYEDEHLLAVNKAAGMIVHPTHGHYMNTLANAVVYYFQSKGLAHRFRPVHRLDQDTSGVLLIAKNPYVHQHVSEQMKAGTVTKMYHAVVFGKPPQPAGTVHAPIDRDPLEPHRRTVRPDGADAITHYRTITRYAHASALELLLETGRTHQIRVHMQHIGTPIVGDKWYRLPDEAMTDEYRAIDSAIGRQALHACRLIVRHPVTGDELVLTAPWPDDMKALAAVLAAQGAQVKPGLL